MPSSWTALAREELGFALWYLSGKGLALVDDHTAYGITASGVDYVEAKIMDDRPDLRVIAAVQLPNQFTVPPPALLPS